MKEYKVQLPNKELLTALSLAAASLADCLQKAGTAWAADFSEEYAPFPDISPEKMNQARAAVSLAAGDNRTLRVPEDLRAALVAAVQWQAATYEKWIQTGQLSQPAHFMDKAEQLQQLEQILTSAEPEQDSAYRPFNILGECDPDF